MVARPDRGGAGLGLAIARGYARAHGGDLTCEDPRGSGALFRLTLPMTAELSNRALSPSSNRALSPSKGPIPPFDKLRAR